MLKENSGRFLIEEITSENEEEFVYNITGKIQEIDFFDNIQLSIPSNIQKSLRKFICDENINLNDKGFKCEILNRNLRKFEDFDEVCNSFYNNHIDEFNLMDFNFNIQRENEFIKIDDFYETQSDFKDNTFNRFEMFDKSHQHDTYQNSTVSHDKFYSKNSNEFQFQVKGTLLNSTYENICTNLVKVVSISKQFDLTIDLEIKQSFNLEINNKITNNKQMINKSINKLSKNEAGDNQKDKLLHDKIVKNNIFSYINRNISPISIDKSNSDYNQFIQPYKENESKLTMIHDLENDEINRKESLMFSSDFKQDSVIFFTLNRQNILCHKCEETIFNINI